MNIKQKILDGQRINYEEAVTLYDMDFFELGELADNIRQKKHGKKTYFNINRHINPTNVCADICKFCAYSANRKNPNPYTMQHDEILNIVKDVESRGAKEVHIVSAHNPDTGLEWYLDIFKKIKTQYPDIHVKALTAAEVDFLARHYGKTYDEILDLMVEYGVDSMPGGGAEIFDEKVRDYICKGKVTSDQWFEIHRKWHERGKKSNVTMLFGHIESRENRIDHMIRIRDLQDITGGFNCFIPLVYQTENNYLKIKKPVTANEVLKYSHCTPPEDYYITSEDMIGKAGVWSHFGSWDFNKASMYQEVKHLQENKATQIITEKYNLNDELANKYYYEIQNNDADYWSRYIQHIP